MSAVSATHSAKTLLMSSRLDGLADYVRRVIREKGLTYRQVADKAKRGGHKLSHSTVGEIIKNPQTSFRLETLQALAYGLGVAEDEIINRARGIQQPSPSEYHRRLVEQIYDELETASSDKEKYLTDLLTAMLGKTEAHSNHRP